MAQSIAASSTPDDAKAFVVKLGAALHRSGAAAPRVEQAMQLLSARFGLEGQFFATPTSIFAAFGAQGAQDVGLVRVEPSAVDLGRRSALDSLTTAVLQGRIGAESAGEELERIERTRSPWSAELATLCYALSSACAARFLGGAWREIVSAGAVGLVIGVAALVAQRSRIVGRVFEPIAAILASALAVAAASLCGPVSSYIVTVSGLVVLLPGLTMTTAMQELAVRHLAAGTARFMGAVITLLSLVFGVALGRHVGDLLPPRTAPSELEPAAWSLWVALVVAPLALGVLLKARARDLGWIVVAGWIAFYGARVGGLIFGPELGAFCGAFVLAAASNVFGRVLHRPSAVALVPGIVILVPGSIGFKSLSALLDRDVVAGVDTAFTMALVAIALAAGMLFGNVVVPPRRLDVF